MLSSDLARMAVTSVASLVRPNTDVLAEVDLPLRVWPRDLDVWGHVNSGCALALMELGRLDHALRTGLLGAMWRMGSRPVVGATAVQHLREVRAFDRCTLVTQLAGWDAEWLQFEHRLERGGELCVRAFIRVALRVRRGTLAPVDLLEEVGVHVPAPGLSAPGLGAFASQGLAA